MKPLTLLATIIGALALGAVVMAEHASASNGCGHGTGATGNWCEGWSEVSTTTGGVSGTRCFTLKTSSGAPSCATTTSVQTTWEADAGGCTTWFYYDTSTGASPPPVPNKVSIIVKFDNTATLIGNILNAAAEPANGATFSICTTDTAASGGNARAGTFRIQLIPVKDNGAAGVGNYALNSDVGTSATTFDTGILIGRIKVASIARNAYPAGATYAYGTASDESITITSTFTQPNGDANVETARNAISDVASSSIGEVGSTTDLDATTLAQAFVVDNTFTSAGSPYQSSFEVRGSAVRTGILWTHIALAGHGAGISMFSSAFAVQSSTFDIDPRIRLDSDGTHTFAAADEAAIAKVGSGSGAVATVYNKGDTVYYEWFILNARGEKLSRAMTFVREDSADTVCQSIGSLSPTANKYSTTSTLNTGATCLTSADATGLLRRLQVTNTMQSYQSGTIFRVSSLYYLHAHIQLSATMAFESTFPGTETDDTAYIISNAVTDTTHGGCWVVNVRKDTAIDTSGSALAWSYVDPASATRLSGTTDTASNGQTSTHLDWLASTPLGTWTFNCVLAAFNGNAGSDVATFTVSVPTGGGGFPGDPFRAMCAPVIAFAGDTVLCTVAASNIDGSARTGAAAAILFDLYNPSGTLLVTAGSVTEQGTTGIYSATYSLGGSPALGNDKAIFRSTDASPVTAHALFTVRVDPTIAIATNVAAIITNQGTAATQVSGVATQVTGVATQVSGVATQVSGVQSTATEIDTDADEILAGQATAATQVSGVATQVSGVATQVSGVATQVSGVQTSANTIISNQASNLAALLAESEESENAQDILINYTTAQILEAISNVNVTLNGNLTINDTAILAIQTYLNEKFGPFGEPMILDISTPLLMTALFVLLLIIAEWKQDALWFLLTAIMGGSVIALSPTDARTMMATILVPVMLYCIFRAYQAMGHFTFRNEDDDEPEMN